VTKYDDTRGGGLVLWRFRCWLLGHDRVTSGAGQRTCRRCGLREALRNYGHVRGWEEMTKVIERESSV
jgi:hypothetical protein